MARNMALLIGSMLLNLYMDFIFLFYFIFILPRTPLTYKATEHFSNGFPIVFNCIHVRNRFNVGPFLCYTVLATQI